MNSNPQQDVVSATTGPDVVYKVNEEDVVIGDEKRESGGNEDCVVEERGETASGAHEQVPRGQSCDGSKRTTHGGVVVGRVTGTAPKDFVDVKGCMDEEMEIRDNERAGRYVATVRPAMASARYVRADARNVPAEMDEDEVLRTEGGVCVPKVVVSRRDDHSSDGESPDTATTSPGEDGVVAELRAARKLEKNQKKRARVRWALAKQRETAQRERQRRDGQGRLKLKNGSNNGGDDRASVMTNGVNWTMNRRACAWCNPRRQA
ncbi:hypothetical protein PI124_g14107 [Phytophthora idaei]|nr:hypothetical protein PI125_g13598 [Phytophthora idaei]KAG3241014.1 hypothetical protein PI124_g14107 [Phytophthora idaei]